MPEPVRICFVIEDLLPAGTEQWIIKLIQHLDRARVEPFICLLNGTGEQSRSLQPDCEVLPLGMRRIKSLHGLRCAKQFRRFLISNRIDIVQVHHADPSYFAIPVAKSAGVHRLIQTKFDVGYWLSKTDLWLHRFFRRFVDFTLANCQACKQASIEQEWSKPDDVLVVANGIPMERFAAVPDLSISDSETVHVGMVCHLRDVKNPLDYVEAAHRILQLRPNVKFHLAGDGPLLSEVEQLVARYQIADQFNLHGAITDVPAFLTSIHIAVLCSQSEGLSHAILEYMAAGRATIATNVGGNSELIEHGSNGLLIPVNNCDALVSAIQKLIDDQELALQLGSRARTLVSEKYSCESMARRFERLYVRLAKGSKEFALMESTAP